jgi:Domain of unknown function (DUF5664)
MSFIEHETHPSEHAMRAIEERLAERPKFLRPIAPRPEPELETPVPPASPAPLKIDHTYLPLDALEEVSRALMYGAHKKEAWEWAKHPIPWTERLAKAQRHILEFQKGNEIDPASGEFKLQHLACAITQLMFLQSYVLTGQGTDDRFKR